MQFLKPVQRGGELMHARPTDRAGELCVKHESESFAENSQLTVDEGQCAVFARGRQLCGIVGPGRHTLSPQHLPFLSSLHDPASGAFAASLSFVTTQPVSNIKLGGQLDRLADAAGNHVRAAAFAAVTLRAADPGRVATTLGEAGTDDLSRLLGPELLGMIGRCASEWLQAGYFTLETIAQAGPQMAQTLAPHFGFLADYGLELVRLESLTLIKR
jgi:hypothetical protein